jgi:septum formation inhibitor MinC
VKDKAIFAKLSEILVKEINQVVSEKVVQRVYILLREKVILVFTTKEAKAKWQSRVELKRVLGEGTKSKK